MVNGSFEPAPIGASRCWSACAPAEGRLLMNTCSLPPVPACHSVAKDDFSGHSGSSTACGTQVVVVNHTVCCSVCSPLAPAEPQQPPGWQHQHRSPRLASTQTSWVCSPARHRPATITSGSLSHTARKDGDVQLQASVPRACSTSARTASYGGQQHTTYRDAFALQMTLAAGGA